jgi:uncharacterized damage-inducible protein DinB
MTRTAPDITAEIETWRLMAFMAREVVAINLKDVTHEESVSQPEPGGNCINWVLGHLTVTYDQFLQLLGEQPVLGADAMKLYARGAPPLTDPALALDFGRLLAAWGEASERVENAIGRVAPDLLDRPVPDSPSGNPDETGRTLITTVLWHQAYHAGQLGVLRRAVGKEGAIK